MVVIMSEFIIKIEINECHKCPFLNCSDTGEDCNLLSYDIQEGSWSNIDYSYEDGWIYDGCPLIYPQNLNKHIKLEVIK